MLGLGKRTGGNGHIPSSDLQSRQQAEEKEIEVKLTFCIHVDLSHIISAVYRRADYSVRFSHTVR